ncbi:cell cycle protein kinase DBF2 [Lodderomyces elongisporus NRRL YB-4239]|uniref:non-specific serine/threonine protein kinase n=1 Tax=Lodderomyces elongisporus (strain ATCC 11503 / CBS 2605 / JCM 1781 / NBRC 1676 / NRRL YB-4239) TaxID=379508 RepID=A5DX22_LODEL|nr:cell cycle protein kinase DBF2 [Lodderomyces elongisporus NRRL YB-4239]
MNSFFNRSPRHQNVQDIGDISQSMENISISSNMMDIDTSYRSPTNKNTNFTANANTTAIHQPILNKENITPLSSPTKSILHTSPTSTPYNKSRFHQTQPQPQPQQQLPSTASAAAPLTPTRLNHNQRTLQDNINQLQPPPSSQRYKLSEQEFRKKANNPKTKRLTSVAQLYFLDYYCDMFDYVISRRERTKFVENKLLTDPNFNQDLQRQQLEWKNYIGRERALLRKRRLKPKHRDFEMITQVGQGGYGQVFLARKKDTREICALKILNKKLLVKLDETRHVLTERDILTNTRSEWLVKLLYAFQDTEKVFLAMEFVPGGDFRTLLNNTSYLIPPHARFYISEMFAAVNSLHELGFTHRDLKPENFLIDSKGHIKLTDFGLAAGTVSNDRIESMRIKLKNLENGDDGTYQVPSRVMMERQKIFKQSQGHHNLANSIVGSPDYMALEVLEGKNYDYTIDYWSLGCMLFEALCGYPPFSGSKQDETYHNLKHWKTALVRPQTKDGRFVFSDRTWALIIKLIASPSNRLRTFKQVQQMAYFADVKDWDNLRQRTPPFTPQLDNEEDAGYFDDFEDEEMMAKYKDVFARQEQNEQLLEKNNTLGAPKKRFLENNFIGFTFKHKSNPNNKFANGEINLLNNQNNNGGNYTNSLFGGNFSSTRLNPLATLY